MAGINLCAGCGQQIIDPRMGCVLSAGHWYHRRCSYERDRPGKPGPTETKPTGPAETKGT